MVETVRLVSDGEELVLSQGEAYRLRPGPDQREPALTRRSTTPPASVVQYLGFHDADGRREYALRVRQGAESREYTLWIAQADFAEKRALLQDGPDICYQLLRGMVDTERLDVERIAVTEGDLASYRQTHQRQVRRSVAPQAQPKAAPLDPEGTPAQAGAGTP